MHKPLKPEALRRGWDVGKVRICSSSEHLWTWMFYGLSPPQNHFILFSLLQYFRMELMHAEKQRREKKEFERAKMDLVGQLN